MTLIIFFQVYFHDGTEDTILNWLIVLDSTACVEIVISFGFSFKSPLTQKFDFVRVNRVTRIFTEIKLIMIIEPYDSRTIIESYTRSKFHVRIN